MKEIESHIYRQVAEKNISKSEAKKMLLEIKEAKKKKYKNMAIIGMGCRLPKADNPKEFWDIVMRGKSCIDLFPESRSKEWIDAMMNSNVSEFLSGVPVSEDETEEDMMNSRNFGGYLEDISKFDNKFFGLSPKESKFMNPEQRLLLQTAWEAIEDAGYGEEQIYGSKTGVFIGKDNTNLGLYKYLTEADTMHVTGSWAGILASRISYLYNLKGPSLVIDTACSAGLVSLHMASKSISNGECDMALVGGVQLQYFSSKEDSSLNLDMVESNDSMVRTFDENASGTVWSEGIVSILIKDLDKAIQDGDNIQAVIKGSAINNDGASNGITAPDAKAQEEVIVKAWSEGEINPETISYFEAHGTGTILGDPIEIKGLTNAFKRFTDKKQFCAIGSTKANIGHTVATSGLAGVIKIIYAMKNKLIPPSINFRKPNPYINFLEAPVYLNDQLKTWDDTKGPLRACINSFGFSGTNCHLVLEAPPKIERVNTQNKNRIFTLSAKSKESIVGLINRYIKSIDEGINHSIEDICYTANTGRGHYSYRLAIICDGLLDLREKLNDIQDTIVNSENKLSDKCFYKYHKTTSNKAILDDGEITEKNRYELTNKVNEVIANDRENLREISELYVNGASLDFNKLYEKNKYKRVSLPTYAFEDKYCWADKKVFSNKVYDRENSIEHPLFDRLLVDSINSIIYETRFSAKKHWVVEEHKLMNNYLVPGITYIEMAREICSRYFKTDKIELTNLIFLVPLVVKEDEEVVTQSIIQKRGDEIEFSICSKDKVGNWNIHAKGNSRIIEKIDTKKYSIDEVRKKCDLLVFDAEKGFYESSIMGKNRESASKNFQFGGRWDNYIKTETDKTCTKELLVTMSLNHKYKNDINDFYLHPALLDNAVNSGIDCLKGVYLPFSYKKLKVYNRIPKEFYSHIIRKNDVIENSEIVNFDVILFDYNGNIILEVEDYSIKRMNVSDQIRFKNNGENSITYCEKGWKKAEIEKNVLYEGTTKVMILKDCLGLGDKIHESFKQDGIEVIEVQKANEYSKIDDLRYTVGDKEKDYESLIKELRQKNINQVIHCLGNDNISNKKLLEEKLNNGVYSLFYLTKAMVENRFNSNVRLHVISKYADIISKNEEMILPENNAMINAAKVIPEEYKNYFCKSIDVDNNTDIEKIIYEIKVDSSERCVAYRNNERYIEEFRKYDLANLNEIDMKIKKEGNYVITGGTGGLGLEIAKFLSKQTNVNLILLNRSKIPERSEWKGIIFNNENQKLVEKLKTLMEIENSGSKIFNYSVNISDKKRVEEVFDSVKNELGNIDGIVHAAGVAGDGFIMNKSNDVLNEVIEPKVLGIDALDEATKNHKLDFFVNFSSIVTIQGMAGQFDYTASNAFLDSYTKMKNLRGDRMICINWPAWKDVGMAFEYGLVSDDNIFKPIRTENAINIFNEILKSNFSTIIPVELNYSLLNSLKETLTISVGEDILSDLKLYSRKESNKGETKKKKSIDEIVLKGRQDKYSEVEKDIALLWCEILDLDEIDIFDNFNSLGGDSILASQLFTDINRVYPGTIEISDIFTYSTVESISKYISGKVIKEERLNISDIENKGILKSEVDDILNDFETGSVSMEKILEKLGE